MKAATKQTAKNLVLEALGALALTASLIGIATYLVLTFLKP